MKPYNTIFEPFRIKSVEPIRFTTEKERIRLIEEAHFNLFRLHSQDVMIDFLTDSGTGAMSSEQWAALQRGDESYAGSPSWYRFEDAVKSLFPFKHVIPTHQGRAAEKILMSVIGGPGKIFPNNTHFDTTRANIEFTGAQAIDLVTPEAHDPNSSHLFKGNMDIGRLRSFLKDKSKEVVPAVFMTVTNNSGGGQPVSLENLRAVREICDAHGALLILDACRFAENAWFIRMNESGYRNRDVTEICHEMGELADGMTMSAKKDGLANIGGWLAVNDDEIARQARNLLILTEGFPTYGGLAGRDLEAVAQGLKEVVEHDYLKYRIRSTAYLGEALLRANVPIIFPVGGHAVYIDAKEMLPHIPVAHYPGQALAVELYVEGGVRSCEIGSVMFGKKDGDREIPAERELVRLAIPRRMYTQSHVDYVIEVVKRVTERRGAIRGFEIVEQAPALRHFTCKFARVG